ncbi:MAG TPA: hypothetical protein VMW49_04115 [Candidatus Dormibacteraeota bacterium]|nr:hypothetical protein [Candidatus Dormibacteraeota bacterium]
MRQSEGRARSKRWRLGRVAAATSRTGRWGQSDGEETKRASQSFAERSRLPTPAWRDGRPGSARIRVGAGAPRQINRIDLDRTRPFASRLPVDVAAPPAAHGAALPRP